MVWKIGCFSRLGNRFSLSWFAEESKFVKQGPFSRFSSMFNFLSKFDELACCRFCLKFRQKTSFQIIILYGMRADLLLFKRHHHLYHMLPYFKKYTFLSSVKANQVLQKCRGYPEVSSKGRMRFKKYGNFTLFQKPLFFSN